MPFTANTKVIVNEPGDDFHNKVVTLNYFDYAGNYWRIKEASNYYYDHNLKAFNPKFKVGQEVIAIKKSVGNKSFNQFLNVCPTATFKIAELDKNEYVFRLSNYEVFNFAEEDLIAIQNNSNKLMDIKESFILATMPEPQKSFRKAGIINGDNIITERGQEIFLTYLLTKAFAAEFKKDIVDPILEEEKKNK